MTTITKNWINLSSADRTSGTSNNFTIQFNSGGLTNNSAGQYGSKSYINPIWFQIPNNAPNIQEDFNNVFYISGSKFQANIGNVLVNTSAELQLPQGVYQNVSQLTNQLELVINGYISQPQAGVLPVPYASNVVVSQILDPSNLSYNKINFSLAGTDTLNVFLFKATPQLFVLNPLNFGTVAGTDENIFTIGNLQAHTLPYLPNLNIYDIIQIKCNLTRSTYELEYKDGSTQNPVLSPSLIMVAFPSANFTVNDNILFNNNNPVLYRQLMNSANYDTIQISITDKNGRLIPFFGEVDCSLTIEREIIGQNTNTSRDKDNMSPYTANLM